MSEDIVSANPLDLAGRTLMFTPAGRGGYSREVRALDWDEEADDAERMREPVEASWSTSGSPSRAGSGTPSSTPGRG